MKKMLTVTAILTLGLLLATPAMAGHRGHCRGHYAGHVAVVGIQPVPVYAPVATRGAGLVFSVNFPTPIYLSPAPFVLAAPVYYQPAPVVIAPAYRPVWVPGYRTYRDGVQVVVAGHWSR